MTTPPFIGLPHESSAIDVNNLHRRDDVDRDSFSHHHTLGNQRNQAAHGDHGHDDLSATDTSLAARIAFLENPPYCVVRASVGASIANATYTTIVWDVIEKDNYVSMDTASGLFVAPKAGWYDIKTSAVWAGNVNGLRLVRLLLNGSQVYRLSDAPSASVSGSATTHGSGEVYLNALDTVAIQYRQDSGGALAISLADHSPRASFRYVSKT